MTTYLSNPGRIGLTQIHGSLGFGVRVGQYLNGSGFENFEHAFMDLGNGTLIQAEPGKAGAQIRPLDIYKDADVHWCDGIYTSMTPAQCWQTAHEATKLKGTPYSFLDYDALVLHHFGLDTEWLRDYIESQKHMICSQLVDRATSLGGYEIFTDDRWDGFVTPGDLYLRDLRLRRGDKGLWE